MYDDRPDLDGDMSWLEILAMIGLAVVCLGGLGYIALKLTGLL